jgi:hypothetical protein
MNNLTLAAIFLLVSQFGLSSSRLRERLGVGPTLIQLPLADLLARGCAECHYQASVRSDSLVDDAVQGKIQGNSSFLRSIQALDQLKAREIAALFERIP